MARPPNADADRTRSRILGSAHHLFSSRGVGSTSIRDVAKRAGVSLAMVHHYFGSKEGLYTACVDAMYEELGQLRAELEGRVVGATSLDDLLTRGVFQSYDFARRHSDAVRLLIRTTVDAGELTPRGREFHLEFLARATQMLAMATGKAPDDLRLPLQTMVFLVARYAVQNDGELTLVSAARTAKDAHAKVVEHLQTAARLLLLGVGAPVMEMPVAPKRAPSSKRARSLGRAMQGALFAARTESRIETSLPLDTKFRLGPSVTSEQHAFLAQNGFLVLSRVAAPSELDALSGAIDRIEENWWSEGRTKVFGVPIPTVATEDGLRIVRRFPFASCFSNEIRTFVRDPRFDAVRSLLGKHTHIGDEEHHGVVFRREGQLVRSSRGGILTEARAKNRGWPALPFRDLLYSKAPREMLNVRLHFDSAARNSGGFRLVPGTHTQGVLAVCLKNPWALGGALEKEELALETEPGDLTIVDKRLWHRQVAPSPSLEATRSIRRSMELPYFPGREAHHGHRVSR